MPLLPCLITIAAVAQSPANKPKPPTDAQVAEIVLEWRKHASGTYSSNITGVNEEYLEAFKKAEAELEALPPTAAPALTRLLPKIDHPKTLLRVATKLYKLDYRPSISVLVSLLKTDKSGLNSLDRPVRTALDSWGYKATPALIRGVHSDDPVTRDECLELVCDHAWNERKNPKVVKVLFDAARSPILRNRQIATQGLSQFTFEWHVDRRGGVVEATRILDTEGLMLSCRIALDTDRPMRTIIERYLYSEIGDGNIETLDSGSNQYLEKLMTHKLSEKITSLVTGNKPNLALAALTFLTNRSSGDLAFRLGARSPQKIVREFALHCLAIQVARFPSSIMMKSLAPLADDPRPEVREVLARALGIPRDASALPTLEKLANDSDTAVQKSAKASIKKIESFD